MSTEKFQVFIVDDQKLILDSLEQLVNSYSMYTCMGTAQSEEEFLKSNIAQIEILLLDIEIPSEKGSDGLEIARSLKENPAFQGKIVPISINTQSHILRTLLHEIQVDGFLDKHHTDRRELLRCLNMVMNGEVYVSEDLKEKARRVIGIELLTSREHEILLMIIEGQSNIEISEGLHIARKTVDNHRQNIYRKLACSNTADLAKHYYKYAYLSGNEDLPNFKKP